mmetsp:Transcript_1478/g.3811  ORF Transcript_1478/g.3811 Transcript_1478/m.3811 type:complete len:465 (+) Transcript_1478:391-1785(+)
MEGIICRAEVMSARYGHYSHQDEDRKTNIKAAVTTKRSRRNFVMAFGRVVRRVESLKELSDRYNAALEGRDKRKLARRVRVLHASITDSDIPVLKRAAKGKGSGLFKFSRTRLSDEDKEQWQAMVDMLASWLELSSPTPCDSTKRDMGCSGSDVGDVILASAHLDMEQPAKGDMDWHSRQSAQPSEASSSGAQNGDAELPASPSRGNGDEPESEDGPQPQRVEVHLEETAQEQHLPCSEAKPLGSKTAELQGLRKASAKRQRQAAEAQRRTAPSGESPQSSAVAKASDSAPPSVDQDDSDTTIRADDAPEPPKPAAALSAASASRDASDPGSGDTLSYEQKLENMRDTLMQSMKRLKDREAEKQRCIALANGGRADELTARAEQCAKRIKQVTHSTERLLDMVYSEYPPQNGKQRYTAGTLKKAVQRAMAHYHPDKQDAATNGDDWVAICDEISKELTRHYVKL